MDGVKEMAPQIESSHQPVDEAVAVNTTDSSSVPNSSSEATAGASTNGIEQDSGNTAETSKDAQSDVESGSQDLPISDTDKINRALKDALSRLPSYSLDVLEDVSKKVTEGNIVEKRFLVLSINGSDWHMIPWAICRTWQDTENFFKLYFASNENALQEISEGQFELNVHEYSAQNKGIIVPQIWEQVIYPGWRIAFSLNSYKNGNLPIPEEHIETKYDNRIAYTVSYYELDRWSHGKTFVGKTTYDSPVEFEFESDRIKVLPVLEEKKLVETQWSPTPTPRRNLNPNDKTKKATLGELDIVSQTKLQVHSQYLLNILRSVVEFSAEEPTGEGDSLKNGLFTYPYKDLYHHIPELQAYRNGSSENRSKHSDAFNQLCDQHIDVLMHYLESQPRITLHQWKSPWIRTIPVTTFAALWLLLKPGSDVYVQEHDGSLNAYVLDTLEGGIVDKSKGEFEVRKHFAVVWNLSFDGASIIRRTRTVDIPIFDHEREITSLPIFPTRFLDDADGGEKKRKLIERGRKYFQYSKGPSFLQYTGVGLKPGRRNYKRARVVVEHASLPWLDKGFDSYLLWHLDKSGLDIGEKTRVPQCECKECAPSHKQEEVFTPLKYSNYDRVDPKAVEELSWHQYLIMSSHMFGFILKDRQYDLLDVDCLTDVSISENAIDALEMDEKNKATIKAIAKTYTDTDGQQGRFSADFIQGKGEGQILLLHGPPGTGKTLTAESVAEFTKRPLLSITAADLGHEPEDLEKNLLRFFRNANDWDAIVLLDEADVYLERRSVNDLQRNSIVSIFLRALDYFQGILFLTTNRVGHFDEAFMARIHVSIGYDRLDDNSRARIWATLFRKLREDRDHGGQEIDYEYDAKEYVQRSSEVKELQWNGREIRNAFQTAVALAVYDSKTAGGQSGDKAAIPKVKESHLKQVVSMSSAFKRYITSTHEGISDSDLAYRYGNRNDSPADGGAGSKKDF